MTAFSAKRRRLVTERAKERCEYCGLAQEGQEATFHIDHILPIAAGGTTLENNLALACVSCSLRKGARQTGKDPFDNTEVPLFHPRNHLWADHFNWQGVTLIGLTATGRATIVALTLNRSLILAIRHEEILLGRHLSRTSTN